MREWQLAADSPLSLRFAADVRLGRTDYADDQIWEIVFGDAQGPALVFQTRYGGRVGLARLVPMWIFDGRPIYEGETLVERPALRAFAPNYARISLRPLKTLEVTAELWVMDSHAVGGRYTMENSAAEPVTLDLDFFAQVVREGEVLDMSLLGLSDGSEALHLGLIGNLNPVLMMDETRPQMDQADQNDQSARPKLSERLTIPGNERKTLRWVHTGLPTLDASLQTGYKWLRQTDWGAEFNQIERIAGEGLRIETGNSEWDAALAFGANVLLRSFVGPTRRLPHASYIAARIPGRGFSPRGDGGDHGRQWDGQTAALGYLALPSVAILAPELARGAMRNAFSIQQGDGWIDFKPGLAGQRAQMLSSPLLASTAWRIYEQTEDKAFATEALNGLSKFFERWFQADMDGDQDGLPEWTNVTQSGYVDNPAFARFRRWAQNADINKAEAPDLAAYLANEARSLLKLGEATGDSKAAAAIQARLDKLIRALNAMWDEAAGSYRYHDRDTNGTLSGVRLFRGKGEEAFDTKTPLDPPNRLLLRIVGGRDHAPRASATIEGIDSQGEHIAETVTAGAFAWYYGLGSAVSEKVYSQVNYLKFDGLSRVYSVEVDTVDLTRHNQTLLLPLWAGVPDKAQASRLVQAITDPQRYWRPFGLPACPVDDPAFAANNDGGSGGVWLLWNTMIVEGLLQYGYTQEAATLFSRLMDAQVRALKHDHAFREAYNSETGEGLGDLDELAGVMPLALFMQMIGLRIVNRRKVWAGGAFLFPNPVKVCLYGVEVTRNPSDTMVKFPSGHTAEVDGRWQVIEDPTPEPPAPPEPPARVPEPAAPPPVTVPDSVPEAPASPDTARVIPVNAKKDDTLEIPITQIDFRKTDGEDAERRSGPFE